MKKELILEVKDFSLSFQMYEKGLKMKNLHVISDLSMNLYSGEVVAVVGSSGSGKSLMATSILGILPRNANCDGHILYKGNETNEKMLSKLRGREIMYVPQSVNNLDPRMKVGKQAIGVYGTKQEQEKAFRRYELDQSVESMYPFQLSGGMARRVMTSMAVMKQADLIIADEPTPGMSVHQAKDALMDFRKMADDGAAVLIITHDIDLALLAADKVAVFYAGTIVEIAPREDFTGNGDRLRHPYTQALWKALPQNDFEPIDGLQPYAGTIKSGCKFADRCPLCTDQCKNEVPMRELRGGEVRCNRAV